MKSCTFFGHKDAPYSIRDRLFDVLEKLIVNDGYGIFYVGNNGNFDRIVTVILDELKKKYPYIQLVAVLAYLSDAKKIDVCETLYPEGIEKAPKRFAIDRRNRWMINHADVVVAYVERRYGGAYKFVNVAKSKKIPIINLTEFEI